MLHHIEELRPFKRTHSLPCSLWHPSYRIDLPEWMDEVLYSPPKRSSPLQLEPPVADANRIATGEREAEIHHTNSGGKSERHSPLRASVALKAHESATGSATDAPIAYDAAQMVDWLDRYRHDTTHCPAGIARFAAGWAAAAAAAASIPRRRSSARSSMTDPDDKPALDWPSRQLDRHHGKLEALGELWEDRQAIPISVGTASRRRGLFGAVEKKSLHHMVTAVLNKVTADPEKFREVKNELLRLPLPEANAEQLSSVVRVFFTKAVRERHFSHSYADLVAALCILPQGQKVTGPSSLTLEHRLRHALIVQCQCEYDRLAEADVAGYEPATEEERKERRDLACGNIHFMGELYLRDVLPGSAITSLIYRCCIGRDEGKIEVPPSYQPTAVQFEVLITAIGVVHDKYFATSDGSSLLRGVTQLLQYWAVHAPVSRLRFLIMSTVEKLQHTTAAKGTFSPPSLPSASPPQPKPPGRVSDTPAAVTQPITSPPPPPPAIVVGGTLLPVPQGLQEGGRVMGEKPRGVGTASPHALTASGARLSTTIPSCPPGGGAPGTRAPNASARPPAVARMHTPAAAPLKPASPTEVIAKLMSKLSIAASAPEVEAVAEKLLETCEDVLQLLQAWVSRCLTVVKERAARQHAGAVFDAMYRKGGFAASDLAEFKGEVRQVALGALSDVVRQGLHEDLRVFQFWAELVLSDVDRVVMDEELLHEGLRYVAQYAPDATSRYLADVSRYHVTRMQDGAQVASDESTGYIRYRPILCLLHSSGTPAERGRRTALLHSVEVRKNCVEADVLCALLSREPSIPCLFEAIRTSPRLTSCPFIAAEVLGAVLVAGVLSGGNPYGPLLGCAVPLLQLVVDGRDREQREMAMVAEVYEVVTQTIGGEDTASMVLTQLMRASVLSAEMVQHVAQYYCQGGVVGNTKTLVGAPVTEASAVSPPHHGSLITGPAKVPGEASAAGVGRADTAVGYHANHTHTDRRDEGRQHFRGRPRGSRLPKHRGMNNMNGPGGPMK